MLNNRLSIQANRLVKSSPRPVLGGAIQAGKVNITADAGSYMGQPTGGGAPISTMAYGGPAFNTTFMGILPEYNENMLLTYYRDCYYYDSVGGATVDIISSFPFSEWTLAGIENNQISKYSESMARLNMRSLLQEISNAYLVDSAFIGSLVYDPNKKVFQDILIHDFANASITPQPFYSVDPVISVNSANSLNQFLNAGSPFVTQTMAHYPKQLIDTFLHGSAVLDPLTTLYLPRKGMQDRTSASYLKRLLPVYMLEKILYRGTLTEAQKRLRSTSHIKIGDDTWEPNNAEMSAILSEFQRSELDPLGAWIATRQGVDVSEVRPGGDFWKWTDNIDTLTPFKLRALGISEAFLSGDASYACLAGDTLIPTTEGLKRIDSFGTGKDRKKVVPIHATMDSRYGKEKASSWQYNGFQDTVRVTVDTGNSVQATGNHPLLVLHEGKTVWKRTDKIQLGDILCVSPNKVVRTKPLTLNVPLPEARIQKPSHDKTALNRAGNRMGMSAGSREEFKVGSITVQKKMSPKLAYWLSLLISEGFTTGEDKYCNENGLASGIGFGNSDKRLVVRFASLAKELFGTEARAIHQSTADQLNERNPGFQATKTYYSTGINNRRLVDWLTAIGVYLKPGKVESKSPSHFKQVPWSILQADEESQRAFLAGYAECDGTISERTSWLSSSSTLLAQIQAMLNSHGYQPTKWKSNSLALNREDSSDFWTHASKYLSVKKTTAHGGKYSKLDGVPAAYWTDFVASRKVKSDRYGGYYETSEGVLICTSKNASSVSAGTDSAPWGFNLKELKRFSYKYYQEGRYDNFLTFLKKLSVKHHDELVELFKTPYRYAAVTSIEDAGQEHVYDVSMQKGKEPAFVANGLVVHNTAEAAISVFLENMDAYRKFITYKLFTSKIFPLIAVLNGMYKDPKKAKEVRNSGDLMHNLNDQNNLYIPEVHWHKSLEAKNADSDFDMLEKLSEKGFSVPMKMWASAAGVDINMMLRDLKEDQEIKKKIEQITGVPVGKQGQSEGKEGEDGGNDDMRFSAMHPGNMGSRPGNLSIASRRKPLLARSFDPGHASISKSGKVIHAVNETRAAQRTNDLIIKASRALRDPNHREALRRKVQEKLGHRANLNLI